MATKVSAVPNPAKLSEQAVTAREIVGIHVKFTLNTPEGLRRIIFELRKAVADDTVTWTIGFQLFQRALKTDAFGDALVDLLVDVDSKLNDAAESMADNGMTKKQSRYALTKAADVAKDSGSDVNAQKASVEGTLSA